MLGVEELKAQLESIGVSSGMTLMVHASLRKLGPIDGRADGVLDALMGVLSADGTLIMPLGAEPGAPFDALKTRADPDIGVLAEVFRRRAGVEVSDHPAGRWGAWGRKRKELLSPVLLNDYHGPGGTLDRFVQHEGWVLRLGADEDTTTLTHLAEYIARVPDKVLSRRGYQRATGDVVWVSSIDDTDGFVAEERDETDDYFSQTLVDFLAEGRIARSRIGECQAELFRGQEFLDFAVRWLEKSFGTTSRK